ncbi:hypothetical protein BC938DRAFT_480768 [Jimgerdemannia flammicorona]|uniref:Uncharacterized protein n=1 Tax=Jimgerdemannia flammicorona TaxID=994334 RepID=A0A433QHR9_9FUNG|nr:hypothetical protein BC938DRAFT_480768 [Jimgerdemannia flammicorona]
MYRVRKEKEKEESGDVTMMEDVKIEIFRSTPPPPSTPSRLPSRASITPGGRSVTVQHVVMSTPAGRSIPTSRVTVSHIARPRMAGMGSKTSAAGVKITPAATIAASTSTNAADSTKTEPRTLRGKGGAERVRAGVRTWLDTNVETRVKLGADENATTMAAETTTTAAGTTATATAAGTGMGIRRAQRHLVSSATTIARTTVSPLSSSSLPAQVESVSCLFPHESQSYVLMTRHILFVHVTDTNTTVRRCITESVCGAGEEASGARADEGSGGCEGW